MSIDINALKLYLIQQKELYGNNFYFDNNQNKNVLVENCFKCYGNLKSNIVFVGEEPYLNSDQKLNQLSVLKKNKKYYLDSENFDGKYIIKKLIKNDSNENILKSHQNTRF